MVLPPDKEDGLGIIMLNSNADTHFSFTNALGLVSVGTVARGRHRARHFPRARWIVAFIIIWSNIRCGRRRFGADRDRADQRQLVRAQTAASGRRVIVMHGHRHIDWIGACGGC